MLSTEHRHRHAACYKSTSSFASVPRQRGARAANPHAQRGQILLLSLLLATAIGLALFVSGASNEVSRVTTADSRTRAALEQARDALSAYAVAHATHPGSLPCPDTDDDGLADGAAACASYLGRLPWRTLGFGDVRDEAGERLWYALSPNFRDDASVQINSDARGDRTVLSGSSATVATTEAAAVVFSPGIALPGQRRDAAVAQCQSTGANVRRDLCASNYLERDDAATPAWNNASATGPYMRGQPSVMLNDKLLAVRTTDFMTLVERRIARETRELLREYRTASNVPSGCSCFPWPDTAGAGTSSATANRGRIPILRAAPHHWMRSIAAISQASPGVITTTLPHGYSTGDTLYISDLVGMTQLNDRVVTVTVLDTNRFSISVDTSGYSVYTSGGRLWSAVGSPAAPVRTPELPPYFLSNNWARTVYYSVARSSLENGGSGCTTCSANPTLSVESTSGYAVVLITPGPIAAGQVRTSWAHYIDDPQNRDINPQAAGQGAAADPPADDSYVLPPAVCAAGQCPTVINGVTRCVASALSCPRNVTAPGRDRMYSITAVAPYVQCKPSAAALLTNAPCHSKGTNVKPACNQAAQNLAGCSCAAAANVMITPPCRNALNPPACQAAIAAIKACT